MAHLVLTSILGVNFLIPFQLKYLKFEVHFPTGHLIHYRQVSVEIGEVLEPSTPRLTNLGPVNFQRKSYLHFDQDF